MPDTCIIGAFLGEYGGQENTWGKGAAYIISVIWGLCVPKGYDNSWQGGIATFSVSVGWRRAAPAGHLWNGKVTKLGKLNRYEHTSIKTFFRQHTIIGAFMVFYLS